MLNREVFSKDPTTFSIPNDGVTIVSIPQKPEEWAVLRYELESFVCSGEYRSGMERVLSTFLAHLDQPRQPAVWVSGFYGSGKSHFVRVLQYLWQDASFPDGARARSLAALPPDIADHFRGFSDKRLEGVLNQVKGRLHERIVEAVENTDGDEWIARLHDDPYHRSTDIVFENTETGDTFEVSLKATDNPAYVEHALSRYPESPVMATSEAADAFDGDERVASSGFADEEMERVTGENFEALIERTEPSRLDAFGGVMGGASLAAAAALWPFVAAWMRDRISREQLDAACLRILGASGRRIIPRLAGAIAFGPIYMWYALARGVMSLSDAAHLGPMKGGKVERPDEGTS